ncbi:hypothetical protein BDEG_28270 [Batrachochytrium dendrobatidis JEL423]|uniref:SPX domain-containing protein n=1 Tax=Batrachochytrium dendrobatidis (strain JEL423) TaxID=403673 RepID=A0A177WYS6_BATDL|nr:hypothetical protein BDEG_28270 [Batrachochytrium dendrobatidis JEL423]
MIAIVLIYSFLILNSCRLGGFLSEFFTSKSDQTPSTSGQRQSRPPTGAKKNRCITTYLHMEGPCHPDELESYDSAAANIKKSNNKLLGLIKSTKRGMSMLKLDLIQLNYEPDVQLASQGHTRVSAQAMLVYRLKSANMILKLLDEIYKDQMSSMMSIQTRLFTRKCPGIREILLKTSKYFKDPKMIPLRLSEIFGDPQGRYVSMFPKMTQAVGSPKPNEATQTTEPDQSTETDIQVD